MSEFQFHEPGPRDESDPGYVYHATNTERAHDIAASGHLHVHRPWHGTDQSVWPDGSTEKRAYFSARAGAVHAFAPEEGKAAVLRVPTSAHPFKAERYTGDVYTTKKIPRRHIEVRHVDGSWHPLDKLSAAQHESITVRTPILEIREKLAFRGGRLNVNTPRGGAWLPKRIRPVHSDAPFRKGPRGKLRPRAGYPLRDEPLRHNIEKLAMGRHKHSHIHSDVGVVGLVRTQLLMDHHKFT